MLEIIGLAVFLAVAAALSPQFLALQQKSLERIRDTVVAGQMSQIVSAANQYIQSNYNTLSAKAGTQTITIQQLEQAGYLSPSVSQFTPYGQNWEVQVSQPKPGYLQGLVISTGGTPMTQVEMGQAADSTKGAGGFIPQAGFPGAGTTATGAYGGWQISMAGYTNPGSGHMVGLLTYYNGQSISNDYLYRVAIPNNPQLNTMQTNIDMGGNNATNAYSYQVTNGGEFDNDQGGSLELGGNNSTAGTGAPYIDFHLGGAGVQDYNVRMQNNANGTLSVYGQNGASNGATLNVDGFIGAYGFNGAGGYPAGWGGGIHTWDLYAEGSVGSGTGGSLLADLTGQNGAGGLVTTTSQNQAFYAYENSVNTGSVVKAGNAAGAYAELSIPDGTNNDASVVTNGNMRVLNPAGSQSFFAYNNGIMGVGTGLNGTVGGYAPNTGCSINGSIGSEQNGTLLDCVNNVWQTMGGGGQFSQIIYNGSGRGGFGWTNTSGKTQFITASEDNVGSGFFGEGEIDLYVCGVHVGKDADFGNTGRTGSPFAGEVSSPIPPGCTASGNAGGYEGPAPFFFTIFQ